MKYNLKFGAALGIIALLAPLSAFAATLSFSPEMVSVQAGQTFSVAVVANPGSATAYSVKAATSFDPSFLQATGFAYAASWVPLAQPGYDAMNNLTGSVIKSGGYPGGFSSPVPLGRITFKALKSGKTTITVSSSSMILDASSKNQFTGSTGDASITIASIPAPVTRAPQKKTAPSKIVTTPTAEATNAPAVASITAASSSGATIATSSLLAAVDGAITFGTGSPIVSALFAAVLVTLAFFGLWFYRRKDNFI